MHTEWKQFNSATLATRILHCSPCATLSHPLSRNKNNNTTNSPTHVSKNAQSRISGNRLEDNAAFLKLRAELKMHLN